MARAPRKTAEQIDAEATVDDRPRYRVMEKSFIGHALVEEGAEIIHEIDDDSEIGENLSPVNAAAQEVVDAQAAPHPDKSDAPRTARATRRRADAAAASVAADAVDDDELA